MGTLFSKIINGEIPSFRIFEDENVFAFLDIRPVQPGHTLIVPKLEIDYFVDVPEPQYSAVFQAAKKIAPALQSATDCKRVGTAIVGFEVPHFHYHLIPMRRISDLDFGLAREADQAALKDMQERILQHL